MAEYAYRRIDEIIDKKNIDTWLSKVIEGGRIIYYTEFPAHPENHLRIQKKQPKQLKRKKDFYKP